MGREWAETNDVPVQFHHAQLERSMCDYFSHDMRLNFYILVLPALPYCCFISMPFLLRIPMQS